MAKRRRGWRTTTTPLPRTRSFYGSALRMRPTSVATDDSTWPRNAYVKFGLHNEREDVVVELTRFQALSLAHDLLAKVVAKGRRTR